MPIDRIAGLQLGLLLMAVPLQYIVSRYMSTNESQRSYAIRNLFNNAAGFKERYLSWKSWQQWCMSFIFCEERESYAGQDDLNGESPAIEVLKYKDPEGYFGGNVVIHGKERLKN
ncbi:uncharacterized protein LOC130053481 [Ostrea edulis]|uniref:uncharacterized protein LOC130053481 n=1 Tax=Ostrea edulis TaxID=37623 RepID=UPI0024AFA537|nr:uncharacterized protein LOC130053481 [Ostrea edulis]